MVMDHIHHEDETTGYLTIGPVSKAIQMLAVWVEDPRSEAFRKHVERIDDYLWEGEDGLKMQGYNGSQLWDTSSRAACPSASAPTSTCSRRPTRGSTPTRSARTCPTPAATSAIG
jgi:cycloartenol synthase